MGFESSTPPTLVPIRNFADYSGAKTEFRTFVLVDFNLLNYLALFVNINGVRGIWSIQKWPNRVGQLPFFSFGFFREWNRQRTIRNRKLYVTFLLILGSRHKRKSLNRSPDNPVAYSPE